MTEKEQRIYTMLVLKNYYIMAPKLRLNVQVQWLWKLKEISNINEGLGGHWKFYLLVKPFL